MQKIVAASLPSVVTTVSAWREFCTGMAAFWDDLNILRVVTDPAIPHSNMGTISTGTNPQEIRQLADPVLGAGTMPVYLKFTYYRNWNGSQYVPSISVAVASSLGTAGTLNLGSFSLDFGSITLVGSGALTYPTYRVIVEGASDGDGLWMEARSSDPNMNGKFVVDRQRSFDGTATGDKFFVQKLQYSSGTASLNPYYVVDPSLATTYYNSLGIKPILSSSAPTSGSLLDENGDVILFPLLVSSPEGSFFTKMLICGRYDSTLPGRYICDHLGANSVYGTWFGGWGPFDSTGTYTSGIKYLCWRGDF